MNTSEKIKWEQQYLTDVQVAKLTGRAVGTLRNERSLGRGLPYSRVGRSIYYNLNDFYKFMNSHKVTPEN